MTMCTYEKQIKWTNDDVEFVKKAIDLRNRGYYINSEELVNRYNSILGKNHEKTNCSSCLRRMVGELQRAYEIFEKQMQLNKPAENNEEKISEENGDKQKPQKAKGRKKKSESA